MAEKTLDELRADEYYQERQVELLRQQVYSVPDPTAVPQLARQLAEAEDLLHELESERRTREAAAGGGVLISTEKAEVGPGGRFLGKDTTGVDVEVLLRMAKLPTGVLHLLDGQKTPLVTCKVRYADAQGSKDYVRLRLTSWVEGYSAKAVSTLELRDGDAQTECHQLPTFFPERLAAVTELTRATLHVEIDDLDGRAERHSSFPVWLLARTSACYGVEDPAGGSRIDLRPHFAAWVTPNSPAVTAVLRLAADFHPDHRLVGYQGNPGGVAAQVKAVFDALKAQQIVYVHSVLSFGAGPGESVQRLRLPRESLANRSANCLDGTVLMASILEAASLNPGLVLIPRHAFLAWEKWRDSGDWDYLETTMIGTHDFEAANAAGRACAARFPLAFGAAGEGKPYRCLSLKDLRVRERITPLE